MSLVRQSYDGNTVIAELSGHITANNAQDVEEGLLAAHRTYPAAPMELDCSDLEYISSSGLRVVLRVLKEVKRLSITNVLPAVYEVFDMTGFTMMVDVRKAYRRVSVDGCPVIGRGAKGTLYRLDDETVCKVYNDPDALDDIERERELARTAFVAGIPTAISYDVVRVGNGYGSVFELLKADTMGDLLAKGEWDVDRVAAASAGLLVQMSQTKMNTSALPSARKDALGWIDLLRDVLKSPVYERVRVLVEAIPDEPHMVHGDYHMGNVMVQDGEPLLVDMDTLSYGNGIFDLTTAYSAYDGRGLLDRQNVEQYLGISYELSCRLWDLILRKRFPNATDAQLKEAENKVRLLSAVRLMGRPLRHANIGGEMAKRTFELYGSIIDELLHSVSTLAL